MTRFTLINFGMEGAALFHVIKAGFSPYYCELNSSLFATMFGTGGQSGRNGQGGPGSFWRVAEPRTALHELVLVAARLRCDSVPPW